MPLINSEVFFGFDLVCRLCNNKQSISMLPSQGQNHAVVELIIQQMQYLR